MLDRLPRLLDADEFEAALTAAVAAIALDPAVPAAYAAHRAEQRHEQEEKRKKRKRKPPAAESFREERQDGWFRPHPQHPWLDPAACGDPGHVPARQGVAVDGKERKGAKSGQNKKVHLLAAVTHVPGIVIAPGQGRQSREGERDQPLQAAAGAAAPGRHRGHQRRDAGEQGQLPVPAEGQERALAVARPGQPAEPERRPERAALGKHARRRRDQRDQPRPDRDPHHPRPARPGRHRVRGRAPGPAHRAVRHVQEERAMAHPGRVRPLPHQPRRGRHHAGGPARPRPRPLAGRAHALATFSGGRPGCCMTLHGVTRRRVLRRISSGAVLVAGRCSRRARERGSRGASVHGAAAVRCAVLDGAG